jgi:hypothetical protein
MIDRHFVDSSGVKLCATPTKVRAALHASRTRDVISSL